MGKVGVLIRMQIANKNILGNQKSKITRRKKKFNVFEGDCDFLQW